MASFKHYCNCGGYAWQMNGRPQEQPHMDWCPQFAEYAEWWATSRRAAAAVAGTDALSTREAHTE
jgi:hypothetical protein